MRILHYSLGLPPYRSGGLTKFCTDLMKEQILEGHYVALLWPGRIRIIDRRTKIIDGGQSLQGGLKIPNYEIINPLPVSYDEGIRDINAFTTPGCSEVFQKFLGDFKPEVIHVHTLMGLQKSFLETARELGIRLIFSAHDFFPICPKVTMFRNGEICKTVMECVDCNSCNMSALSLSQILLLQSVPYRLLKNSTLIRMMRNSHRNQYLISGNDVHTSPDISDGENYKRLRSFYKSMLCLFDVIHYNSTLTETIYLKYLSGLPAGCVIPITHGDIVDHRKKKKFEDSILRIRYLGSYSKGKGYITLIEALNKLWSEHPNFQLDIHFKPPETPPYVNVHGRYCYDDLEYIFNHSDVLVVPSIWYETFGYTVLEAFSYGVPVVLSETVGAKDIVTDGAGIISGVDSDNLYDVLKRLNSEKLSEMNNAILERQKIVSMHEMEKTFEIELYTKTTN
ncbi:glycosyltransferase [Butyrivibrio sp. XPD2006]|uniref:glycosyltransferase n=1 Tax=Butyrivibrio sp. XPD2006 TaxID=1280668 RepID=UPI0004168F49|nr:glycosyltransferase [Butyrivibrio sp. XPD2006]